MKYRIIHIALVAAVSLMAGCSTTKRLGEGEVLYTGVKKMEFVNESGEDIPSSVISRAKEPISVAPNNPLYSPYWRTHIPTGLWAWNYLYTPKEKGFKSWLYGRLSKEPVTLARVQPELRLKVVGQVLDNNGYFGAETSYQTIPKRNPKKAKVSYRVTLHEPWRYDSVSYLSADGDLGHLIDGLRMTTNIKKGERYVLDTLHDERTRVTNLLRNEGYYYFRPDYIEYLADTSRAKNNVDLRMKFSDGVPPEVLRPYHMGKINITVKSNRPTGGTDTTEYDNIRMVYEKPMKIRPKVLAKNITIKEEEKYTAKAYNNTQTSLNKLGVFRYVNMNMVPLDSVGNSDKLDLNIEAAMDMPLQSEFEAGFSSKSNSFIGPGAMFQVSHNNFFGGAEKFAVRLKGSYEWQTGNKRQVEGESGLINSYEIGLDASLSIPDMVPHIIKRPKHPTKTTFRLGGDLMNRPGFFRMLSLNTSATYDFQSSKYSYHSVTPFKLVYNNLLNTSESFDNTMADNPAIALSFQDQFIPSMGYTYTYDRNIGARRQHRLLWTTSAISAGNVTSGMKSLFGKSGDDKTLFGSEFSQFVKGTTDVRLYRKMGESGSLAMRFSVGAGYAYGNSEVLPYSEQFYIGGANSIRAFTIRTIGPGSYRPDQDAKNAYLDQTGDFKLEANIEYRFKMLGRLGGALFVDAGNIWLLKEDPKRPGGKLEWKNLMKDIALGTGFGFRYDISYLVLRADLGVGVHTPYENPDRTGYYNVESFGKSLGFHIAIGYPF